MGIRTYTFTLTASYLLASCELPLPDYSAKLQQQAIAFAEEQQASDDNTVGKRPALIVSGTYDQTVGLLVNPFYCPIHITFSSPILEGETAEITIPAKSTARLPLIHPSPNAFQYQWEYGEPFVEPDNTSYLPPFLADTHIISQSFGGRFSHTDKYNYYAVDIALPVGAIVSAARDGIVIEVTQHYTAGGKHAELKSKANNIAILHSDGTFADYSHLQPHSALVNVGDEVRSGQPLARSGATGYVNAPHLHFVVWRNTGTLRESVPFEFEIDGKRFKPKKHLWLTPPSPRLVK